MVEVGDFPKITYAKIGRFSDNTTCAGFAFGRIEQPGLPPAALSDVPSLRSPTGRELAVGLSGL
jgi:hypothetical protein